MKKRLLLAALVILLVYPKIQFESLLFPATGTLIVIGLLVMLSFFKSKRPLSDYFSIFLFGLGGIAILLKASQEIWLYHVAPFILSVRKSLPQSFSSDEIAFIQIPPLFLSPLFWFLVLVGIGCLLFLFKLISTRIIANKKQKSFAELYEERVRKMGRNSAAPDMRFFHNSQNIPSPKNITFDQDDELNLSDFYEN